MEVLEKAVARAQRTRDRLLLNVRETGGSCTVTFSILLYKTENKIHNEYTCKKVTIYRPIKSRNTKVPSL